MNEEFINKIIHGDAVEVLRRMPSDFVDCIVTSPPYHGLRDYSEKTVKVWDGDKNCEHEWEEEIVKRQRGVVGVGNTGNHSEVIHGQGNHKKQGQFCKKCGAWLGQLGLEPSLNLYLNHLLQITTELKRVLKPSGVMFWVHGDSYGGSGSGTCSNPDGRCKENYILPFGSQCLSKMRGGRYDKSLLMAPERFAMRMIDEQGWILRNKIVWYKRNHMPESVNDRFTNAYEYVFMFTKNRRYWFNLDPVRQPRHPDTLRKYKGTCHGDFSKNEKTKIGQKEPDRNRRFLHSGKNPGDVYDIKNEHSLNTHIATFPEALVKRCLKVACPEQICKKCGHIRERIKEKSHESNYGRLRKRADAPGAETSPSSVFRTGVINHHVTTGWTDCGCNAGWASGIMLDPFIGSGTSALVALKNNRRFIGIDANGEYVDMAYRIIEPLLNQTRLCEFKGEEVKGK